MWVCAMFVIPAYRIVYGPTKSVSQTRRTPGNVSEAGVRIDYERGFLHGLERPVWSCQARLRGLESRRRPTLQLQTGALAPW
jgi:hypothetical protein